MIWFNDSNVFGNVVSANGAGVEFYWYEGGAHNNTNGHGSGGTTFMSLWTSGLAVNGAFVSARDRNLKELEQTILNQKSN